MTKHRSNRDRYGKSHNKQQENAAVGYIESSIEVATDSLEAMCDAKEFAMKTTASTKTAKCDICNAHISNLDGFIVRIRDVITQPAYWNDTFQKRVTSTQPVLWKKVQLELLYESIKITGWLLCEKCASLLNLNNAQSAKDTSIWWQTKTYSKAEPLVCVSFHNWHLVYVDKEAFNSVLATACEIYRVYAMKFPNVFMDRKANPVIEDDVIDTLMMMICSSPRRMVGNLMISTGSNLDWGR